MTPPDKQRTPDQEWDDAAHGFAAVVAVVTVLPLMVAWTLARLTAGDPRAWYRRATMRPGWWLAASILAITGLVAARGPLLAMAWPLGWNSLIPIALWWVALIPAAVAFWAWRMGRHATALSRGRMHPQRADHVRRAIWNGADRMARQRATGLAADRQTLGVVIPDIDDLRDSWTWLNDRRDTGRDTSKWVTGPKRSLRRAVRGGQARLTLPADPPRLVVVGGSGTGKTTTVMGLIVAALDRGWRVAYIDGKGDSGDAATILGIAAQQGKAAVHWPACPYDGWQGNTDAVVEKALMLTSAGAADPSPAAIYYRAMNQNTLHALGAKGPWTSTTDLLERLHNPAQWVTESAVLADLNNKSKGGTSDLQTVRASMTAALRPLIGVLDGARHPQGWSWDEHTGAPWDLALVSVAEEAHRYAASVILTDLNQWRVSRKRADDKPLLVIMDEAQTILDELPNPPSVATQIEQFRSARIGIVLATQSPSGLGEQGERILSSGADLLTARLNDAEEVVRRAGTRKVPEYTYRPPGEGDRLDEQSAREQNQHRLDPDRLKEAGMGRAVLLEAGQPERWIAICPPSR